MPLSQCGIIITKTFMYKNLYPKWYAIRAIFILLRFGGESVIVSLRAYGALWFKGKELNLVLGLQQTVPALVSELSFSLDVIQLYSHTKAPECSCLPTNVNLFGVQGSSLNMVVNSRIYDALTYIPSNYHRLGLVLLVGVYIYTGWGRSVQMEDSCCMNPLVVISLQDLACVSCRLCLLCSLLFWTRELRISCREVSQVG